jgi:pimeloyl-ACP methyl ester carboxylesterase
MSQRTERRAVAPLAWFPGPLLDPTPPPEGVSDEYGSSDPEWLGIDWREHLHWIRVLDTQVCYCELGPAWRAEGDGRPASPASEIPIVFVHGLSGSWQNWLENIPYFARGRRVVALDLPGFGQSPMPPWDLTIEAYGRLLGAFCDEVGIERCDLVGNSMGGFVATEVAISDPDRVDRLALVSAAGISHARMARAPAVAAARVAAAATPYAFKWHAQALTRPVLRHYALRGVFYKPTALGPEIVWENLHASLNAPGMLAAVEGLVGYDFTDRLPEIDVPTLIVWGRQDRVVPPADSEEFLRLIPNSRRVIFDRCGHVPQLEKPARFNALLEEFLGER